MAEDESRTDTTTSASSKYQEIRDDDNQGWLQLSIGGNNIKEDIDEEERCRRSERLIELDLLPSNTTISSSNSEILLQGVTSLITPVFLAPPPRPVLVMSTTTLTSPNPYTTASSAMFFQHPAGCSSSTISSFPHQDIINNWGFGSWSRNTSVRSFIPSTSGSVYPTPFQIHSGVSTGSGIDFRVIDPPRQPHSGIWFMLQAAQNQTKEPYLPQISKNFLRIKDGRITIRLVQKYLVNKLKLESEESEIEIRCRGQQVEAFLTLQHVRDSIWKMTARTANPRETLTLLPNSSTIDHIMVLNYARTPS